MLIILITIIAISIILIAIFFLIHGKITELAGQLEPVSLSTLQDTFD